jgi:indole-3-glycerol phosphate synthase
VPITADADTSGWEKNNDTVEEFNMANSFLKKVAKGKKIEVEKFKKRIPHDRLLHAMLNLPPVRNFREGLLRTPYKAMIAEYKRCVPDSRGFKPKLSFEKTLRAYELGGASAISILTDEKFFGGKLSLIAEAKQITGLPILRKDFIIDPYQIYESRAARADAVLLIAALLPEKNLNKMIALTSSLGMAAVVEVRALLDMKRAARAGADLILINNRDLATLKINMQTVSRMVKQAPKDVTLIAASGYQEPDDLEGIESERIRAVLIGRALLETSDPERLLHQFINKVK